MAHPEDEMQDEARDWTPESEAARDPEKRLDRLIDKAEKNLDIFAAEARVPAAPRYAPARVSESFFGRAQIEIRRISNGFILSYSKTKPVLAPGLPFEIYEPIPVEAYIMNVTQAAQVLYIAMAEAEKLELSAQRVEAHQDALAREYHKAARPPAAPPPIG